MSPIPALERLVEAAVARVSATGELADPDQLRTFIIGAALRRSGIDTDPRWLSHEPRRHDPATHDCKGGVRGDLYPMG